MPRTVSRCALVLLVAGALPALACTEPRKQTPPPETYAEAPFTEPRSAPAAEQSPVATATPTRTATPPALPTPVSAADIRWIPEDPALVVLWERPAGTGDDRSGEPWRVFYVKDVAADPRLVHEGAEKVSEESLQWPFGQQLYFSTSAFTTRRSSGSEPSNLIALDLDDLSRGPWKVASSAELYPSPDGTRQALMVRHQQKAWLYIRDGGGPWARLDGLGSSVDMATPSRRFPAPDWAGSRGWSPDGQGLMLYVNGADSPGGQFGALWYLPVGGRQATFVAASLVNDLTRMWWLPDSSRFVFAVVDGEFLFDPKVGRSSCVTTGRIPPSCLGSPRQLTDATDHVQPTSDGHGFLSEDTVVDAVRGVPLGTLPSRTGVYRRTSLSRLSRSVAETLEVSDIDRPACALGDTIAEQNVAYDLAPVAGDQQTYLVSPVSAQPHILNGMVSAIDRFGSDAPPALTTTVLYDRSAARERRFDYCVNANGGVTATWLADERHLVLGIAADMWNYWSRIVLLHAASGNVTPLTTGYELRARVIPSPDGARVLVIGARLRVYTMGGRLLREIVPPEGTYVAEAAWSPDGASFAYVAGPMSEYPTLQSVQDDP